jgi:hypothetical protein
MTDKYLNLRPWEVPMEQRGVNKFKPPLDPRRTPPTAMQFHKQAQLGLHGNTNQGVLRGFDALKVSDQNSSKNDKPFRDSRIRTPGSIPNQITDGTMSRRDVIKLARDTGLPGGFGQAAGRAVGVLSPLLDVYDGMTRKFSGAEMQAGTEAYMGFEDWILNAVGLGEGR